MPTYVYVCPKCNASQEAVRSIAGRDDCPACEACFGTTERRIVPTMVAVPFQPYTTAVYDKDSGKPVHIRNRDEHRAFLVRNGLEEVGNDKSMAPPSAEEVAHRRAEKLKEQCPAFQFDSETHEATT